MRAVSKDHLGGAIMAALGAAFTITAWWTMPIGTVARMGPGFVPIGVGLILTALGLVLIWSGGGSERCDWDRLPVRGGLLVAASVAAFALLVGPVGFVGAMLVSTVIGACSTGALGPRRVLITALAITVLDVVVFVLLLGQRIPLLGPLVGG